jgi:hypothetical protein
VLPELIKLFVFSTMAVLYGGFVHMADMCSGKCHIIFF